MRALLDLALHIPAQAWAGMIFVGIAIVGALVAAASDDLGAWAESVLFEPEPVYRERLAQPGDELIDFDKALRSIGGNR